MAKLDLVTVDKARYIDAIEMYFLWKELDQRIRTCATRGINFPEAISEALCCYAMGYKLNKGSGGDAFDAETGTIVELKATSNWGKDTTSFSPSEDFDKLVFLRLNKKTDELFIYDLNINADELKLIEVNKSETVYDQQVAGRRPRFSIIKFLIEPRGLEPIMKINLRTQKIVNL